MQITVIPVQDLAWPFTYGPIYYVKDGAYTRSEPVDPFPCYAHDAEYVKALAEQVTAAVPLSGQLDIYCPAYEGTGRTNGHFSQCSWGNSETYSGYIVLHGKRIPPHPAMTRYLVSHEYGHAVQYWIEWKYKAKDLPTAYCKDLRGYESQNKSYGGKTWHAAVGEIFANDFRLTCTGLEPEFWPHEGIERPANILAVGQFWERVRQEQWQEALAMLPSLEYEKD